MKISSALIAATLLAGGVAYQYDENRNLQATLNEKEAEIAALGSELQTMRANLDSMRGQLMNLASALQAAREKINGEQALTTSNDLSQQLHGKQPPNGSSTAIRPPSSNQDLGMQMARMQANVRYGDFVAALPLADSDKNSVAEVIAEVFVERIQVSQARTSGSAGAADLERVGSTAYLREQLAAVLSADDLASYDNYEANFQQLQMRNTFALDISRFAPALTDANRELVLDALMNHLGANLRENMSARADAVTETQRQLMALGDARNDILGQLNEAQAYEAEKLLTRIRSAMVQSQAMNEGDSSQ